MAHRTVVATLVADFEREFDSVHPTAYGVGTGGSLYVAACANRKEITQQNGCVVTPKTRLSTPAEYHVFCWRQGQIDRITVKHESILVSFVQPVAEGILLVGARCRWSPQGAESNGVIADRSGQIVKEITFGDGIEDVRVTDSGTIWVSYFDEGVFGNFGWQNPGPEPIGAPGLVAFTPQGELCFSYSPSAAQTDAVCDVYAMNVGPTGEVWIYFYTEFSIVRIDKGRYAKWNFGMGGAHGIAVNGEQVLLVGDYDDPDLGRLVQLGKNGTAQLVQEFAVVDDSGEPIHGERMYGMGSDLYLFRGSRVWVVRAW